MENQVKRVEILMEALPYIREFRGKSVVIKYGGAAMDQADLKETFALDVILLHLVGINPVIIHGGGPQIGALMKRLGKEPRFVGGMRVTDAETVEIVEMVLVGKINKQIVGLINHHGGQAVGLSGKDASLLRARRRGHRLPSGEEVDIGLVGEVEEVNTEPIRLLEDNGFIPVIAPVGVGRGPRGPRRAKSAGRAAGRRGAGAPPSEASEIQGRGGAGMDTKQLLAWAAQYHTPNYSRAPICLVRGDGVRVWDSDGKEYLDFGAGLAVASLGHCHPRVTGAIREAAATLLHVSNLYHTAPQIHLAKLLCDHSFADRVFF